MFFRAHFARTLLLILGVLGSWSLGVKALLAQGEVNLIPNGGFEDSNAVKTQWHQPYGRSYFEDSISLKGTFSLGLEARNGHIDLFLDSLKPKGTGAYKLSFWYRAEEGYREGAPFWVEVIQNGRSVEVFRPGVKEERERDLTRDWVIFNGDFTLSDPAPVKLFIHSDLSRLWLDKLSLKQTRY